MPSSSHSSLSAIILAAGQGVRMKSSLPKVMHPVAGQPMLFHVVDTVKQLNISHHCIVVNPQMANLKETLAPLGSTLAVQEKQLGTAHAVQSALDRFILPEEGKTLILYADTPLITKTTLQQLIELDTDVAVLAFETDNPTGYGRLITGKKRQVSRIVEHKDATSKQLAIGLCNSGVMVIRNRVLRELLSHITNHNAAHEYYLTDIITIAHKHRYRCRYTVCPQHELLGVNDRTQLAVAESTFQKRKATEMMLNGVTLIDPSSVFFATDTSIEPDVTIHPFVTFGPGVHIKSQTVIHSFSHIEHATIGSDCQIGPFARIRPGTELKDHVKIGNFVEIKKSRIEKGSKVNHLSYIGDSTLGKDVNVGAGTITCNYDGQNKHQTDIQDGAFIGSNTALVAPVTIGNHAMIGAGSTITKDVAANALAVTRAKQLEIADGATSKKKRSKNTKSKPST